jgi:hypothetical protein
MDDDKKSDLERRLRFLSERINKIADEEARSDAVGEAVAQGALYQRKLQMVDECEEIVDRLQGIKTQE